MPNQQTIDRESRQSSRDLNKLLLAYASAIVRYERLPHRQRVALGGDFVGDRSIERICREDVDITRKAILTRDSRVPSPETIDRVCVGLAKVVIHERDYTAQRRRVGREPVYIEPRAYVLLCLLLDIPTPIPDWAELALESHTGTPEEFVSTLRELFGKEYLMSLEPPGQGICATCGGGMTYLTPEFFRARGMEDKPGGWIHNGVERDHFATKGEPE